MSAHRIGDISISRVIEQRGAGFAPDFLFPDWDPAVLEQHKAMMIPQCFDEAQGRLISSIHTWVLKTAHRTILIDSCAGNHKNRPALPRFHQLNLPFLDGGGRCISGNGRLCLLHPSPCRSLRLEHAAGRRPLGADISECQIRVLQGRAWTPARSGRTRRF
jgi:hypothetical protein